ncbi:MAG: 23S rRNA (uracil(1939)-C(5))-methyltransferase RlmD [Clostridium sp.]|nr:23S rRNA (uracil(1939)-C(5))-methyltransferase RlmD [Clostridium sp.]
MRKGDILEGVVKRVDFPNRGIVEAEIPAEMAGEAAAPEEAGEEAQPVTVTVKNVIPGQKLRFSIAKKRGERLEGRLLETLAPSELETAQDVCPHFGTCGGCLYQTMTGEAQLAMKEAQIQRLFRDVCSDMGFEGMFDSPKLQEYRNKMEFTFGDACKDGPLALGMHRRGSFYDIVTADHCRIVHPDFCSVLAATRDFFADRNIPFLHRTRHSGYLRHLLVRRAEKTGEMLVCLVTTTQMDRDEETKLLAAWKEALLSLPLEGRFAGILHTRNDSVADVVKDEGTEVLYGSPVIHEELLGLTFEITPFSFFQTNSLGAEVLYGKVREYALEGMADPPRVIFDLYSGTGTIAQILAPVAEKVVGVEIVEEAVEAARKNAAANGLSNCEFIAGDVLRVVDGLSEKPDLIILDPPRDGIHPKAIGKIIAFGVKRMVYVSCKPTSLVRDLEILQNAGYRAVRTCCVNMFPSTSGIETVMLLERTEG